MIWVEIKHKGIGVRFPGLSMRTRDPGLGTHPHTWISFVLVCRSQIRACLSKRLRSSLHNKIDLDLILDALELIYMSSRLSITLPYEPQT